MQANGYSKKEIHRASNPKCPQNKRNEEDKPLATAYMPYFHRITDLIGKLLKKYRIKTNTESSKYYARPQTAVTRGLAGRQTAAASKHSLCYFSLFSE